MDRISTPSKTQPEIIFTKAGKKNDNFVEKVEELLDSEVDLSKDFLSLHCTKFNELLRINRKAYNTKILSINIDWIYKATARRLKAFLEDSSR